VAPVIQPKAAPPTLPEPEPATPPARPEAVAMAGPELGGTGHGIVGGAPEGDGAAPSPGPSAPRVDFDESMTSPRFQEGPSIEYSPEALREQVEGLMVVRCIVTAEGRVYGCRVQNGLPFMDEAVLSVLQARRYTPAMRNGSPLEVNYTFRIRLRLPR